MTVDDRADVWDADGVDRIWPRRLAAILLIILCSAGCSGNDSVEKRYRNVAPRDADAILTMAEGELRDRCMRELGFRYFPVHPDEWAPEPLHVGWGLNDLGRARREGYGLSVTLSEDPGGYTTESEPTARYLRTLSHDQRDDWEVAYFGDHADMTTVTLPNGATFSTSNTGCVAEARIELYGSIRAHVEVTAMANYMTGEIGSRVMADSSYQEALARWQECMSELGYSVTAPSDAYTMALEAGVASPADARVREISIAVDDARCNVRTRLTETAEALEKKHSDEFAEENEAQVLATQELQQHALERAREILGIR
jgi:hypothetical protein